MSDDFDHMVRRILGVEALGPNLLEVFVLTDTGEVLSFVLTREVALMTFKNIREFVDEGVALKPIKTVSITCGTKH